MEHQLPVFQVLLSAEAAAGHFSVSRVKSQLQIRTGQRRQCFGNCRVTRNIWSSFQARGEEAVSLEMETGGKGGQGFITVAVTLTSHHALSLPVSDSSVSCADFELVEVVFKTSRL